MELPWDQMYLRDKRIEKSEGFRSLQALQNSDVKNMRRDQKIKLRKNEHTQTPRTLKGKTKY